MASVAAPPPPRSYWPTSPWRSATPESQGMDSAASQRAAKLVEFYNLNADVDSHGSATMSSHADAFAVVKGGYIVAERYWGSTNNATMQDLESTTKSISCALIAHAIKRGILSAKTPVSKFYDVKALTPAAASAPLLLENVVSMSGGMNGSYWKDRSWFGHCRDWNRACRQGTGPDGVESRQFVADHGALKRPGSSFVYSWTNTGLASGMFTKAAGMGLAAYATQPSDAAGRPLREDLHQERHVPLDDQQMGREPVRRHELPLASQLGSVRAADGERRQLGRQAAAGRGVRASDLKADA